MAKNNNQRGNNNYYPQQSNDVINQIPNGMNEEMSYPEVASTYDIDRAANMAQDIVNHVKSSAAQAENAYDAKKMERMVKGMSYEQQEAMARQFNHYALLAGLKYQFEHLDELESDINTAFSKLASSREEI